MDMFGIGAALKTAFRMYQQSARQTGRTTSMLEALKDGDRVVCLNGQEAHRLRVLAAERRLTNVAFIVLPVTEMRFPPPSKGRTIFDHSWVEAFYLHALTSAEQQIDFLQRELSGVGTAHIETRLRAQEIARWRL